MLRPKKREKVVVEFIPEKCPPVEPNPKHIKCHAFTNINFFYDLSCSVQVWLIDYKIYKMFSFLVYEFEIIIFR